MRIVLLLFFSVFTLAGTLRAQSDACISGRFFNPEKGIHSNARGTFNRNTLWRPGQVINIRFLNGDPGFQQRVRQLALQWTQYANLRFNFVEYGDAQIRVYYRYGLTNKSCIGTDALQITDQQQPTITFGFDTRDPIEFSRKILHEFGHAIGLEHEHFSPYSGIRWNRDSVYEYYRREMGWDAQMVEDNIFKTLDADHSNGEFDTKSIMLYAIPNKLINLPESRQPLLDYNYTLSDGDKRTIAALYPFRQVQPQPRKQEPVQEPVQEPIPETEKTMPRVDNICSAVSSITVNGNLKVYPAFEINDAVGKEIEVIVYFYDNNGNPIINTDGYHIIETGQLIGYDKVIPPYQESSYNRAQLRFGIATSLSYFNLRRGETMRISYKIALRRNGKEFVSSELFYRDIGYDEN